MKLTGIALLMLGILVMGCSSKYPLKVTEDWIPDKNDIRAGCPVRYLAGEDGGPPAGDAGKVLATERVKGRLRVKIGIQEPYAGCVHFGTAYVFHAATNGVPEFMEIRNLRLDADKLPTRQRWLPHGGTNPKVPNVP